MDENFVNKHEIWNKFLVSVTGMSVNKLIKSGLLHYYLFIIVWRCKLGWLWVYLNKVKVQVKLNYINITHLEDFQGKVYMNLIILSEAVQWLLRLAVQMLSKCWHSRLN